ncbi:MAG: hypothetical protein KAJ07_04670 [Planctomycetes bacterium]|nr:hypothetical protein [Planctomycetota bacterium]
MTKQLPIAFTAENAFKVQQDLKTQSRRLITEMGIAGVITAHARYQVGDHLWIQEPYIIYDTVSPANVVVGYYSTAYYSGAERERAKVVALSPAEWAKFKARKYPHRKSPGRFMYKSLARTWVEVTDIRAERVNQISDADALAEGVSKRKGQWRDYLSKDDFPHHCMSANDSFATLWDSIHVGRKPKPADEWKQFINGPYAWVYTFKQIDPPTT